MPKSFEYMVDDPTSTGLCDYCDDIPCSSHPAFGCVFCEGSHCEDAYNRYVEQCEEEDDEDE